MTLMDHDVYSTKLAARFATFDHDHDGRITAADFDTMAERILAEYNLSETSPKGAALMAGARQYFTSLAQEADIDGDGEITRQTFVNAAQSRLRGNKDGFARVIRPWAAAVVEIADTNGDGSVDLAEWARMLMAMGAVEPEASKQAKRIDTDGDGTISLDEVIASAVDFYTSDHAHAEFGEV
ncbi:EF-hand domain-containing protein [Streptomyces sp. NPDC051582]|uniref:EF-hand domain-containing protein n=1 Tax=Streptomyces sp. NPDC051582 TaxID=3155167 RepID=UPI003442843C